MHRVHQDQRGREQQLLDLDEIARQGARRMLAEALEAEVEAYIEAAKDQRDEDGRALVVRNGHAREREILLGAGKVEVKAPRVNDRRVDQTGERRRFKSMILPPYMRRSPKVTEVLLLLYLHGLSSGDFVPALEEFFGSEAGLSLRLPSPASPSTGNNSGNSLWPATSAQRTTSTCGWTAFTPE
jgi:transposase-like protein